MGLLGDIQEAILDNGMSLSAALLKARVLADRLESDLFVDWVAHEIKGYPSEAEIPQYRYAELIYTGTFVDMVRQINGFQVPNYIIRKVAGDRWIKSPIRLSIGAIDSLIEGHTVEELSEYGVSAADLIPRLNDVVFEGMSCIRLNSKFAGAPFVSIQQTVRARLLELTLEIERQFPLAREVTLADTPSDIATSGDPISQIVHQQVFMGNVGNVTLLGDLQTQTINIMAGDPNSLKSWLADNGVDEQLAEIVSKAVAKERPDPSELKGDGAWRWIKDKLGKGAATALEVGKDAGKDIIVAGVKAYFDIA